MTQSSDDTIAAIATPPGRGGIGVVRLAGGLSFEILRALFAFPENARPAARAATLAQFKDPETGRLLDQVLVTCFPAPHSYTGEDVVEISCHGAPVILRYVVECCVAKVARPAEPGEFTERAFLNGRIDLTQAEAIRDLIDARTLFQARVAARQMEGSVSARVKPCKETLLALIAELEAGIDFAEDDVAVAGREKILGALGGVQTRLAKLSEGYAYGRIVREGLSLAIIGRPNVGKSSLFNRLLNEERAIVTEISGTTRDVVSETASLDGVPFRLADTAGIRESVDVVEKAGIERSLRAVADSDLRLLVLDASADLSDDDRSLIAKIRPCGPLVIACNKCDLPARLSRESLRALVANAEPVLASASAEAASRGFGCPNAAAENGSGNSGTDPGVAVAWTSALTGAGIAQLKSKILAEAAPARSLDPEGDFITNLRHQKSIEQCLRSLAGAREAASGNTPHEMLLLDLYEALHALDELTGATSVDDVLGVIFSTFCVGK